MLRSPTSCAALEGVVLGQFADRQLEPIVLVWNG